MKPLGRFLVAAALAGVVAGCGGLPAVFEDVGDDPHPPELTLRGIALQPPGDPLPRPAFLPPDTVLTVRPFDEASTSVAFLVAYRDDGADLSDFIIRDRGLAPGDAGTTLGTVRARVAPAAARAAAPAADDEEQPLGTSGVVWLVTVFPVSVEGLHQLEMWAEDTRGSRSEKTPFAVNVQLF